MNFFSRKANRDLLERQLRAGDSDPTALDIIVNSVTAVGVRIYRGDSGSDYVNVRIVDTVKRSSNRLLPLPPM